MRMSRRHRCRSPSSSRTLRALHKPLPPPTTHTRVIGSNAMNGERGLAYSVNGGGGVGGVAIAFDGCGGSSGGGSGVGGGGGVVMGEDEVAGHGGNAALAQGVAMDGRIKRMVRVDDRGGGGRTQPLLCQDITNSNADTLHISSLPRGLNYERLQEQEQEQEHQ